MIRCHNNIRAARWLCFMLVLFFAATPSFGQVSPAEISNLKLKAIEQKYLPQLQSLHKGISDTNFPFSFLLTRYVTANPDRPNFDPRGIEFVNFQDQVVLKTSGIYRAAFDADLVTQNQRAVRTFREVIIPILGLMAIVIPSDIDCDAIGFEISYYARAPDKSFDFEGKEILAIVLSREDAFALASQKDDHERQTILNRSAEYVNGKEFGLALDSRDPLDVDARARFAANAAQTSSGPGNAASTRALNSFASGSVHAASNNPREQVSPPSQKTPVDSMAPAPALAPADPVPARTRGDAERLQNEFQPQLDALAKEGGTSLHLVDYAPPSFSLYHNKLVLQLTLRNPLVFERSNGSIYKRAAQGFDLFLAPELKPLMQKLPPGAKFDAFDFSVLNHVAAEKSSSEAIEYICPVGAVRSFVDDEITSQDLVNQSIVLVNGVRISLNLEQVE
jgi:hypothetical protein